MMLFLKTYWRALLVLLVVAGLVLMGWAMRGLAAERDAAQAAATQAGLDLLQAHAAAMVSRQADASAAASAAHSQIVYRTIHDKVIQYVDRKDSSASCMLDLDWVRLHDAAATGRLPDAAGAVDAARP